MTWYKLSSLEFYWSQNDQQEHDTSPSIKSETDLDIIEYWTCDIPTSLKIRQGRVMQENTFVNDHFSMFESCLALENIKRAFLLIE